MPSSVQHGSTSPSATSPAPCVVDRGQLELGDERRARQRRVPVDRAPATVQRDCGPTGFETRDRRRTAGCPRPRSGRRRRGRRAGPAARRPGRAAPSSRRCGTAPRRLRGRRRRRAGRGPTRRARRAPGPTSDSRIVGFGLGLLHQLVAAGRLERPQRLAAVLVGVVAEVEDHRLAAASSARDSRMRCISMLPEDTVEACEYFQWSSTSPRNQCRARIVVAHLGGDVHQHLGAVLVELGHRDPVGRRVAGLDLPAALQRDHPVGQQTGAAAVRQHPDPAAAQFGGQLVPAVAQHRRAPRPAAVHTGRSGRCRPARRTSRPARSTSPRRRCRARRPR